MEHYVIELVNGKSRIYQNLFTTPEDALAFAESGMKVNGTPHFVTTYEGINLLLK